MERKSYSISEDVHSCWLHASKDRKGFFHLLQELREVFDDHGEGFATHGEVKTRLLLVKQAFIDMHSNHL